MTAIINILFSLLLLGNNSSSMNIEKILHSQLKGYNKIEYSIISPKDINLSSLQFDDKRSIRIEGSRAYLPVVVNGKSNNKKNTVLTLNLKLYKDVLVCNRNLKRKEELSPHDFSIVEKEISNLRFKPTSKDASIELYRMRTNAKENTVLQKTMIEKIPDVKVGDRVEAVFINNSVNINFYVCSRSEGLVGDIIRVKRDDNKLFKAKVINNTTVKIIE